MSPAKGEARVRTGETREVRPPWPDSKLLSPREVGEYVGWSEQRALRLLKRLNAELHGMLLLDTTPAGAKAPRFKVMFGKLKKALGADALTGLALHVAELEERVGGLEERATASDEVDVAIAGKVSSLETTVTVLRRKVSERRETAGAAARAQVCRRAGGV